MQNPKYVFAYGTLTITEILVDLLGKVPKGQWAALPNYRRCRIDPKTGREAKGPAARPAPGEELRGMLLELDEREWEIFEAFESSASGYEHVKAEVILDDGSKREAIFYAADEELQKNLVGVWDAEEFRQKWLKMYLDDRIPPFMEKHGFEQD